MILLAMDRAPSVRRVDIDGRLHVETSNISKANVCPYLGAEIPGGIAMGLAADRIYYLLRDPAELAHGIASFNNLPILSEHIPVTAHDEESHMAELVVGSTGTDAAIDGNYVTNSLVIWAKPSIDGIVNNEKRELSSAYRYRADMTPGNFEGVDYDGVMRDIVGNHVALVFEGRAGSDVIVGDEKPMAFKSKRALMVGGGLAALIRPHLAADAKLDLSATLGNVTAKSLKKKGGTKALADTVFGLVQPMLAADAKLEIDAVLMAIDAAAETPMAEDEDDEIKDKVAEDEADEDIAEDEADEDDKPAMDAAAVRTTVSAAVSKAEARIKAEQTAIRTAEREVAPVVGELVAMDSAADVYAAGLKALSIDITALPIAAFGETFRAVKKARDAMTPVVAMDAAAGATARTDFDKRYPKRMTLVKG